MSLHFIRVSKALSCSFVHCRGHFHNPCSHLLYFTLFFVPFLKMSSLFDDQRSDHSNSRPSLPNARRRSFRQLKGHRPAQQDVAPLQLKQQQLTSFFRQRPERQSTPPAITLPTARFKDPAIDSSHSANAHSPSPPPQDPSQILRGVIACLDIRYAAAMHFPVSSFSPFSYTLPRVEPRTETTYHKTLSTPCIPWAQRYGIISRIGSHLTLIFFPSMLSFADEENDRRYVQT